MVYTVHSSYSNYKLMYKIMLFPVFSMFKRIVRCSGSSYESLPVFFRWLAGGKLYVIRNGVNLEQIDRVKEAYSNNADKKTFTIVWVGRLIDVKNPISILKAFHQYSDQASRLVFVGDGRLKKLLVAKSKKLGLEGQVELTGFISREEVYNYLIDVDLFVSISKVEGLPVAVLEAMACRCTLLLSDIHSHREIAGGMDFIPLVHADDFGGLTEQIRKYRHMPLRESSCGRGMQGPRRGTV